MRIVLALVAMFLSGSAVHAASLEQVRDLYGPSLVYFGSDEQSASTGIVIGGEGFVLTTKDSLKLLSNPAMTTIRGRVGSAQTAPVDLTVVARDPSQELALLRFVLDRPSLPTLPSLTADIGETLYALGFEAGGHLASNALKLEGESVPRGMWELSGVLAAGQSGGVLINRKGMLAGVIVASDSSLNRVYALPISKARYLFGLAGIAVVSIETLDSAPDVGASVSLFVKRMEFGIPLIPDDWKKTRLGKREVEHVFRDFARSGEFIELSLDEARALNELGYKSRSIGLVIESKRYYLSEFKNEIAEPVTMYFELVEWSKKLMDWANSIERLRRDRKNFPDAIFSEFSDSEMGKYIESNGIMNALVVSAVRGDLSLAREPKDCLGSDKVSDLVAVFGGGDGIVVSFRKFAFALETSLRKEAAARDLSRLLEDECYNTLERVFRDASRQFAEDHKAINSYIEKINDILRSRLPSKLSLVANFSNGNDIDVFLKPGAMVRVAATAIEGSSDAVFSASAHDVESYIRVPRQSSKEMTFSLPLSKSGRELLSGKAKFEENYVWLTVEMRTGTSRQLVNSNAHPFSDNAKKLERNSGIDLSKK